MRVRQRFRKLADIDRELSGKLAKCWYMAIILAFFLFFLMISVIYNPGVVLVSLLLVDLYFWVASARGIIKIKKIRLSLRENPQKFRSNGGEYTIPDVNIILGGIVRI